MKSELKSGLRVGEPLDPVEGEEVSAEQAGEPHVQNSTPNPTNPAKLLKLGRRFFYLRFL